ncbi:MAG: RNA polymerase sigma-54 factor, partial [Geopsychrobacter sp.]|nr:RNA polymerase sigma-54 factor [Geopsychrobacter sp.]
MALDLRLQVKLSQQLVMTPQLQQAIKLLQLSRMELVDVVTEELAENPLLEEGDDQPTPENQTEPENQAEEKHAGDEVAEAEAEKGDEAGVDDIDWQTYLEDSSLSSTTTT